MDMVSNCISEKAHAGDGHDGRNYLLFSIDILGCVRAGLDLVVPVTGYPTPYLAEVHFPGYIIKCDLKANALSLGFVVP